MGRNTFSIVTPNYNMASFLSATIESVLRNMKQGDEYFVIDGGSSDGSVDVIRKYEASLTGWITERDKGYADALVKGFKKSSGTFMCWINSGDLLLDGALDTARQALSVSGANLIFGDDIFIDEQNRVISYSNGRVVSLKNMMLYGGWTPLQDACFWERSLYDRIDGINSNLKYAADFDFFLRASCTGYCLHLPKVFSAFRRHDNQISSRCHAGYEDELRSCRQRMLAQLNTPVLNRLFGSFYYRMLVILRHYIGRHIYNCVMPHKAGPTTGETVVI